MSLERKIIKTLEFAGYPIAQTSYAGKSETYFVFRIDKVPTEFTDDAPGYDIAMIQIHLFAPFTLNTRKLRQQVRKAFFDAGFTYPVIVDASETERSSDGTEQHIVFECEIEEVIEDGGII